MKLKFPALTITEPQETKQDRIFIWSLRLSIFFSVVCIVIVILHWQRLPPTIPLFFSLPWGEEQLGSPLAFLLITFSGVIFSLINGISGFFLFAHSPLFARMLFLTNVVISLLIMITTIQIVLMIT